MTVGAHLTEQELVDTFQVSRSPIRGALAYLEDKGIVRHRPNRGYFATVSSAELRPNYLDIPTTTEDRLFASIVRDWFESRIPRSFSQTEFCRRYDLGRWTSSRILLKLSEDGIVSRNRGHGWRFELSPDIDTARDESYLFRMEIEPGAILSRGFDLDRELAGLTRRDHLTTLDGKDGAPSVGTLADIDATFHRMIGVSSRNRFFLAAVERQNSLRRALSYVNWDRPHALDSWSEYMDILDALERGEREEAADLMRLHLARAHDTKSE